MVNCEHVDPDTGRLLCQARAETRVSSAIRVVIGHYCGEHLPEVTVYPGWIVESIDGHPPNHRRIRKPTLPQEEIGDGQRTESSRDHRQPGRGA